MNGYSVCRLLRWCSVGVGVGGVLVIWLVWFGVCFYVDMIMGGVV